MAGSDGEDFVSDYADVRRFELAAEREEALLRKQTECTFMWSTRNGEPMGVIMNYVWREGRFWLTATRQRQRIPAILARPRVAIAVSSRGTDIGISQSLTYRGTAQVHESGAVLPWMYAELANAVRPDAEAEADAFAAHLANSAGRVVIEVVPDKRIGFDSEAMFANSPAGRSRTEVR